MGNQAVSATTPSIPNPLTPARGPYRVLRVTEPLRAAAAERLVAASTNNPALGGKRFLAAAAMHGISLEHLWGSVSDFGELGRFDRVRFRQACLAVPGSGRTAMFFTSAPATPEDEIELGDVIAHAAGGLSGVRLGQTLLEVHETQAASAYKHAGFLQITTLAYLRRAISEPLPVEAKPEWPAGVTVEPWRVGDDAAMIRAMERSYIDTLDCAELCGMRETRDVFDSHRAAGAFDARLWHLVRFRAEPAGAMLLNPSPEQQAVELVYLGLAPELRGMGLAGRLLSAGLASLRDRREQHVTCAVDERNAPALRLYARLGFTEVTRRLALVKPL